MQNYLTEIRKKFPMNYNFTVFLMRIRNNKGVFTFPSNNKKIPGLYKEGYQLEYLNSEIKSWLASSSGISESIEQLELKAILTPDLFLDNSRVGRLYLLEYPLVFDCKEGSYQTLPEILRSIPKDRNRLPYIKSLQVFAGSSETETIALELDDSLKQDIKSRWNLDDD